MKRGKRTGEFAVYRGYLLNQNNARLEKLKVCILRMEILIIIVTENTSSFFFLSNNSIIP